VNEEAAVVSPADAPEDAPPSAASKPIASNAVSATKTAPSNPASKTDSKFVQILYGSESGNAAEFAKSIALKVSQAGYKTDIKVMDTFEPEDLKNTGQFIFVVSTHTGGTPPSNAKFMYKWLKEAVSDFRVHDTELYHTRCAVFGLGSSDYSENYNAVAKKIFANLCKLGSRPLCNLGMSDCSDSRDDDGYAEKDLAVWINKTLIPKFKRTETLAAAKEAAKEEKVEEIIEEYDVVDSDDEEQEQDDDEDEEEEEEEEEEEDDQQQQGEGLVDLEDLGSIMQKKNTKTTGVVAKKEPKPMLNEKQRKNLGKQGYKIIGSHSGVKICRWTKAMLRGRGGCYKHTFYGIASYQCMEMTPSLACANKCVFCWRHHTNPVGKEWKWFVDQPRMILDQAIEHHRKMIKQMKGVPGVKPDRYKAAFNVQHCALSLVGEPIMYPHINTFLGMLHDEGISSFLVTNAQFPENIKNLDPVTQMYVSIDASTKESLKAVDRPLFKDFWPRFLNSLEELKKKNYRSVYRMTLVKGFNMDEIAEYAKLILMGRPTFIEIKGVTFCGTQLTVRDLTMKNVPWHVEVRQFCQALCKYLGDDYELACEHVHSCCILIADTKLKIDGKWNTWIDYPKFNELITEWKKNGTPFDTMDYIAPTPDWAVFGSSEEGFDPEETRWRRKQKDKAEPAADEVVPAATA